jgi:hypothetical protein
MTKTEENPSEHFCLSDFISPDTLCDTHPQSFDGFPLKGAPADRCRSPSFAFPSLKIPQILSQRNTGRKSAHFHAGQILNPYPHRYGTAFAFSDIPYPHPRRRSLRFAFPGGRNTGLPCSA